jgi:hypothetical protein
MFLQRRAGIEIASKGNMGKWCLSATIGMLFLPLFFTNVAGEPAPLSCSAVAKVINLNIDPQLNIALQAKKLLEDFAALDKNLHEAAATRLNDFISSQKRSIESLRKDIASENANIQNFGFIGAELIRHQGYIRSMTSNLNKLEGAVALIESVRRDIITSRRIELQQTKTEPVSLPTPHTMP